MLRHGSQSTLEQVIEYEALTFQHASQNQAHYDAVCQVMEQLKRQKK